MIRKRVLNGQRVRRIRGGFSFIPHCFVTDGYLDCLGEHELLLYFFLVAVSDRYGLSFYSEESILSLVHMCCDDYHRARQGLIEKDLIAYDGTIFQVLDLPKPPDKPVHSTLQKLSGHLFKEV